MVQFRTWIFGLFPEFYKMNDSYKDANNEGLLERYLKNVGLELDDEFVPFIENFMDLVDPLLADPKYLPFLGTVLGSPITLDSSTTTYRRIIEYAVAIYKIKGTQKSYQLLFNLIGINVKILEEKPKKAVLYDQGWRYDEIPTLQRYDQECEMCSYYSIAYNSVNDTTDPVVISTVPQSLIDKFANIICFLQPINAKLRGYIHTIHFEELYELNIIDEITGFNGVPLGPFDDGFDDGFDTGNTPP